MSLETVLALPAFVLGIGVVLLALYRIKVPFRKIRIVRTEDMPIYSKSMGMAMLPGGMGFVLFGVYHPAVAYTQIGVVQIGVSPVFLVVSAVCSAVSALAMSIVTIVFWERGKTGEG